MKVTLLNRDSKFQKGLDKCSTASKRAQMPGHTITSSKTFKNRCCNKTFHGKTKVKQYLSTNPAPQKVLDGTLQCNEVNHSPEHKEYIIPEQQIKR